jgi:hypothetical protein
MSKQRARLAVLLAAALSLAAVAPVCAPPETQRMPCCRPAAHCDAGMRASGCCRFEPSSPAAPEAATVLKAPTAARHEATLAALASVTPDDPSDASLGRLAPEWGRTERADPRPLYLLNSSILR